MEGEGVDGSGNGGGTLLGSDGGGQQQQQFTPTFENALGKDGAFAEGWAAKAFGAEYSGPLATVKTMADVNKLLADNMAAARGKAPSMPGEKSTPEEIAAWRKITGAPEKPDGYGALRPESIPEAMWDKGAESKLAEIAHKHHLNPSALKDIMGLYAETLSTGMQKSEAEFATYRAGEESKLKAEFGKDFDLKVNHAKRFAATLGLKLDNPIFNDASVVIAMARGHGLVSEDKLINGNTQGLSATPKMQATSIMTDQSNPLYGKYQSGDPDTVSLVNNLLMQGG